MKSRTIDAIALEPIRNNKGSYRFFSINTKRVFVAEHFVKLPMTDTIIKRLNEYAAQDYGVRAGQPLELGIGGKVVNDVHEAEEEHNVHMPRNIVTNILLMMYWRIGNRYWKSQTMKQ